MPTLINTKNDRVVSVGDIVTDGTGHRYELKRGVDLQGRILVVSLRTGVASMQYPSTFNLRSV